MRNDATNKQAEAKIIVAEIKESNKRDLLLAGDVSLSTSCSVLAAFAVGCRKIRQLFGCARL
jgi:hypothetical protein